MPRRPKYTLAISASANGRVGRATVKALDADRKVIATDKADLSDAKEREKLIGRMAARLGHKKKQAISRFAKKVETAWNSLLTDHQRAIDAAAVKGETPPADTAPPPYLVSNGRICRQQRTPDGAVALTPLCNFSCRIVEQITTDDGVERSTSFALEGTHATGRPLPRVVISAKEFPNLNWVVEHWGTSAVVCAGQSVRDHLRCAIQTFSEDVAAREADRILRAVGNHAGRMRMRADTTLRPEKPPRGLPLSTGEDTPRGQSLRARVLVNEVSPGDVSRERLTECQRGAADGQYAQAMAAFVRWLAPQYEEVKSRLRQEQTDLRERARAEGQHARTPGIFASLALGLRYFLDFAKDTGALGEEEATELWTRGFAALAEAAAHSSHCVTAAEPTRLYLQLLCGAIASGRAHVAGTDGNEPQTPQSWGWRREEFGNNPPSWRAQGRGIGWLDGDFLYLEPTAAFAMAQEVGAVTGEGLAIGSRTLATRLREAGLLTQVYQSGGKVRNTIARVVEG
jgi:hypothetical protein